MNETAVPPQHGRCSMLRELAKTSSRTSLVESGLLGDARRGRAQLHHACSLHLSVGATECFPDRAAQGRLEQLLT